MSTLSRAGRARRHTRRGATVIEFALVFCFIILPLLLGIVQYGYHYWALETGAAAAREAARASAVGTDWECSSQRAADFVSAPAVGDDPIDINRTFNTSTGQARVGSTVTVTVSFQSLHIGFLPLPQDGRITQDATARVEHAPSRPGPCRG